MLGLFCTCLGKYFSPLSKCVEVLYLLYGEVLLWSFILSID